jgi:hypothetical protein
MQEKLFLLSSAALLAVPTFAGVTASEAVPSSDWRTLDSYLAATGAGAATGPSMGALIRSSIDLSGDEGYGIGAEQEDLTGLRFQDAMLWASGTLGDFNWRLSFDFANSTGEPNQSGADGIGGAALEDAYAQWNCCEQLRLTMGQYKCPPLRSSNTAKHGLLFIDRTILGDRFGAYSPGVAIDGNFDAFHWKLALQNGADGASEDVATTARVEYYLNGGVGNLEGAMGGKGDGVQATIGATYFDEGEVDDGSMLGADATVIFEQFSVAVEIADLDDDLGAMAFGVSEGNTPWAVTGSWLTPSREWEVAARFQDLDDDDDTQVISGGLNWYHGGHNAKWQLNVSDYSSDAGDASEGTLIQIGLTVGSDS